MTLPSYIEAPEDADGVFAIYPGDGIPSDSQTWDWREHAMQVPLRGDPHRTTTLVHNVVIPTLTLFRAPASVATGTSVVIGPGGAFSILMVDYEGYEVARALANAGITAFVLRYRLRRTPDREENMDAFLDRLGSELSPQDRTETQPPIAVDAIEEARTWADADGRQAIRWVRQNARNLELNPGRIGIAGFSAGGGVAVSTALYGDPECRPDFVAGIYPAYRRAPVVPVDAPPLFLAAADEDVLVASGSTAALYQAWHNAGSPAELHIFCGGAHGFGIQVDEPTGQWVGLFLTWLDALGLHRPRSVDRHSIPDRWADEAFAYLTTTGRRTGQPHRIEIWFGIAGGSIYLLSGGMDRSDWVRNLQANPNVTVELGADRFTGVARVLDPGTDEDRLARELLVSKYRQGNDLETWGRTSLPIVIGSLSKEEVRSND
jgi:deazaflavin-dependent oxidoreductase (nitroreductase family)